MTTIAAKRFTIDEYHRLIDLGFFAEDDRIELIRGELIPMVSKSAAHSVCNTRLGRKLLILLGDRAICRIQEPILLPSDSEPEPDVAIVRNCDDDYLSGHPTPEDILLVIEVSNRTLAFDREVKLSVYAEAGIGDYWIFNLVDRVLECYSQPYRGDRGQFSYRKTLIFLPDESVNLPHFSDLDLDLSAIFPEVVS
ncbi:MAG TPA: Uma2 family endonuclease [Oscillatoriales cyanobacterium M59_W2019_021]|nr:MAG: Uma2 family endonuclease [Cyanobacteria bacterium J055]HIK32690.1 Uma2 family endonuclease [Oscillatoriales cyanobacterium M4454_W2019_049]HIK50128.1 Uma2 family endonuclease [Oscillatoriales cyanobacterium M59_W2019_021]